MDTDWFDTFHADGLIIEILAQLKSGKEATVFICRGGAASAAALVAVKSYTGRLGRGFQNRAVYQHGRVVGGTRTTRAVANKSRFGRRVTEGQWVAHEFAMLSRLHAAGADVPRALAASSSAIVMEYLGSEEAPAPQLRQTRLDPGEAQRMFARLLWNVELFLANNVIHADLSAYNILVRDGKACIIDLPQAVDPRTNAYARELLARDVDGLTRHFARLGVPSDPEQISDDLWQRFQRAELRAARRVAPEDADMAI